MRAPHTDKIARENWRVLVFSVLLFLPGSWVLSAGEKADPDRQQILTTINDVCRFKDIDIVRGKLYSKGATYVVNGHIMKLLPYLEELDKQRALGKAGAVSDTSHVEVTHSGSLGYGAFLSDWHGRIDDDESQEMRMNLMVLWKEGEIWKILYWFSSGIPK